MGTIYKVYTDKPLADLNMDYQKLKDWKNWTNIQSDMHLHS
jgi:hypothetical protein